MSQNFSLIIKTFISLDDLNLSKLKNFILENNFTILSFVQNCIDLFLELNFCGPLNTEVLTNVTTSKDLVSRINEELICEGEIPFSKTKGLILLWISKSISQEYFHSEIDVCLKYRFCVLFLQCIYLHKSTLRDHTSQKLKSEVEECLEVSESLLKEDKIDYLSQFELVILGSHLCLSYYMYETAKKLLEQSKTLLGMETDFSGAVGKRTKFQVKDLSQLYVSVSRTDTESGRIINEAVESSATKNLPNDMLMDDELLLDEIKYVDLPKIQRCSMAEQSVLLLQSEIHMRMNGKNEHVTEECNAIIFAAMGVASGRSSSWSLTSEALLQRSRFIGSSSRAIERNITQLEELVTQYSHSLPESDGRRQWFFLSRWVSIWELQCLYGETLLKLGMTKSALDILLNCDEWKHIIECYTTLGQREKAVTAIEERLRIDGDSAELLCCLGDVTQNRCHYEKAWLISKERSARAMRSLAIHYMFVDRNHEKAADCFEKSLSRNVMQVNTWFTYGCCCVQIQQYSKAVTAFKKCVSFENDNFEAWNNCASALMELGELENALIHLNEGVKYNYENWKLWDNICIVSALVGDFGRTIFAYNRCIDLQKQHRDPTSLSKAVRAIVNGALDFKGNSCEKYRKDLKLLFGRISACDGRDASLNMLQAELLDNDTDSSEIMKEKVVQCLSKSYNCMTKQEGWEKNNVSCKRVITAALRLADATLKYGVRSTSARLSAKSVLTILKNRSSDLVEDFNEEVSTLIAELEDVVDELDAKSNVLK